MNRAARRCDSHGKHWDGRPGPTQRGLSTRDEFEADPRGSTTRPVVHLGEFGGAFPLSSILSVGNMTGGARGTTRATSCRTTRNLFTWHLEFGLCHTLRDPQVQQVPSLPLKMGSQARFRTTRSPFPAPHEMRFDGPSAYHKGRQSRAGRAYYRLSAHEPAGRSANGRWGS